MGFMIRDGAQSVQNLKEILLSFVVLISHIFYKSSLVAGAVQEVGEFNPHMFSHNLSLTLPMLRLLSPKSQRCKYF